MLDRARFARSIDAIPDNRWRGARIVGTKEVITAILREASRPLTIYEIAAEFFNRVPAARVKYGKNCRRVGHLMNGIAIEHLAGGLIRLKRKP
jgi:hypothetical protein